LNKKRVIAGLLISLVFLYLAFRESDWGLVWRQVKTADYRFILAGIFILFLAFWFRALRWRYLLLEYRKLKMSSLFGATMIGYMSLNLLPLRIGEFVRAYALGQREGLSKSGVFATIIIERIFDGFTVLLLLFISIQFLPLAPGSKVMDWVKAFSYFGFFVYFLAAVFVVLIKLKASLIVRLTEIILSPAPVIRDAAVKVIAAFASGLNMLSDFKLFAAVLFFSLVTWLLTVSFYWLMLFGFSTADGVRLGYQAGFSGGGFVTAAIALGIMIPSSPGFVGTYEFACVMALTALGVEPHVAESYSIVSHAAQFLPITLVGIAFLYLQHFTFREIRDRGAEVKAGLEEIKDQPTPAD